MMLNDILFHQDKTKILSVSNTRAWPSLSAKPGQACGPEQTVNICCNILHEKYNKGSPVEQGKHSTVKTTATGC